jgi:hypothetical protein
MPNFIPLPRLRTFVMPLTLLAATTTSVSAAPPSPPPSKSDYAFVHVRSDRFFNATNLYARGGESFLVKANRRDVADLSTLNGSYKIYPDGTIAVTPPPGSGAFEFFRDNATPVSSDPVIGSRKSMILFGHLPGAPYGALVAGFSTTATPTSFSDFPYGFQVINFKGIARAPAAGGYLFLGVNDSNNPGGDNGGEFRATVIRIAHGAYDPLAVDTE